MRNGNGGIVQCAAVAAIGVLLLLSGGATRAEFEQELLVDGPFRHQNLAVYIFRRDSNSVPGMLQPDRFLTLSEAVSEGVLTVHETGTVNELSVENASPAKAVFIQAGEILKGGKQDRVISKDLLLPPQSGKVPVGAFCVEQGRWAQRGLETTARFSGSTKMLSSKRMKLVNQLYRRQSLLWKGVATQQADFLTVANESVRSKDSPSSLQLSLESKAVEELTSPYLKALQGLADEYEHAVGFAFAVNGELNSAELFRTSELFRRQWPRMLEAAATEAVSAKGKSSGPGVSKDELRRFIRTADSGRLLHRSEHAGMKELQRESESAYFIESRSTYASDSWLHRSYLRKEMGN